MLVIDNSLLEGFFEVGKVSRQQLEVKRAESTHQCIVESNYRSSGLAAVEGTDLTKNIILGHEYLLGFLFRMIS